MLCREKQKQKIMNKHITDSLQAYQDIFLKKPITFFGRVSPCISLKQGSLSVEAAFSASFFFITVVILISLIDMFRVWSEITVSLNESAKKLGMYAYASEAATGESPVGAVGTGICISYAYGKLPRENRVQVSLLGSSYENHIVKLRARVTYYFPVRFYGIGKVSFICRSRVRAWTGYDKTEESGDKEVDSEMVYVTQRQTVYHTHSDCTHLQIAIETVPRRNLLRRRNQYGSRYAPCPHCKPESNDMILYVTPQGESYHARSNCSALKRTGHLVEKTSVSDLNLCSRCASRG